MKDLFRNKRIMFPIIIFLIVIVIAILVLVIIGMDTSKGKRVDNVIFDNTSISSGTTNVTNITNTSNTSNTANATNTARDDDDNENTVNNNTSADDDNNDNDDDSNTVEFGGEQFYLDAANDFAKALTDEEEMRKFVDNHVDVKAYIACYNNNGDDSKFMDEYNSIELSEDDNNAVIDIFADLAQYDNAKLTALTDPRQSGDSSAINRVTLTIKTNEDTQKIRMVFYQDVVIYIYDENGDSIVNFA